MLTTDVASGLLKADARALLRTANAGLADAQVNSALKQLSKGRIESVSMRIATDTRESRLYLEHAWTESGFQRMSFKIAPDGTTQRVVQTAFGDTGHLVRQKPGAAKNNVYDVKK